MRRHRRLELAGRRVRVSDGHDARGGQLDRARHGEGAERLDHDERVDVAAGERVRAGHEDAVRDGGR